MANTAVLESASPNHATFLLTGDGTVIGPTIANATLLAAMKSGPLKSAWNKEYADQDAMRTALLGGGEHCRASIQLRASGVDITAEINQIVADVDVDAVTAEKAELNLGMSDTTGQFAYLTLSHAHSFVR